MAELVKNPKVMEKAQAEVRKIFNGKGYVDEIDIPQCKYLSSIVKESLRMHPPGVLQLPRENTERCVINGYEIPEKTKIIINVWAIGRDPKSWDEAETFNPGRFLDNPIDFKGSNFEYIPFGAGRRICPGITYATINIELLLANFLYNFDGELQNGMAHEKLDMSETFGASVRRTENLLLIPVSYVEDPMETNLHVDPLIVSLSNGMAPVTSGTNDKKKAAVACPNGERSTTSCLPPPQNVKKPQSDCRASPYNRVC